MGVTNSIAFFSRLYASRPTIKNFYVLNLRGDDKKMASVSYFKIYLLHFASKIQAKRLKAQMSFLRQHEHIHCIFWCIFSFILTGSLEKNHRSRHEPVLSGCACTHIFLSVELKSPLQPSTFSLLSEMSWVTPSPAASPPLRHVWADICHLSDDDLGICCLKMKNFLAAKL